MSQQQKKQVRHDEQLTAQIASAAEHTEKAMEALDHAIEAFGQWRGVTDHELEFMNSIRSFYRSYSRFAMAIAVLNIVTAAKEPKTNG